MASRHHSRYIWLLIPGFLAGLLLATYEEARAGSGGNAAAAGAAGLAIGLIIGGMAAEQQKQQQPQQVTVPNCRNMHGAGAVNAASNPSRCVCRSGYTRVSDGGSWHCAPRDPAQAQARERGIGGSATQSRAEIEKIQENLNLLGYDAGVADGAFGEKTRQAILRFQAHNSFPQTGQLSAAEQKVLFKTVEERRVANNVQPTPQLPTPQPPLPDPSIDRNPSPAPGVQGPDPREVTHWESVRTSKNPAELQDYINRYRPDGAFIRLAELRLQHLAKEKAADSPQDVAELPPVEDPGYPKAREPRADAVAVIIGNSAYKKGVPRVDYGVRDAEALKLLALSTLGVDKANVIVLKDANRIEMDTWFGNDKEHKGKLWRMIEEGQSDLYVFYSGHGVPGGKDNNGAFLLPVDADPNHAGLTAYPLQQLLDNLAKLPAKSTTVFVDACFSGRSPDARETPLITQASPVNTLPKVVVAATLDNGNKVNLFAAAEPTQLASWDVEKGHGIFTRYVLSGLAGEADENKDKQVTAAELDDYLRKQVRRAARRAHGREQDPSFVGTDRGIVIARF